MAQELGLHAEKWLELIIQYRDDPSKFELPEVIFGLPDRRINTVVGYLSIAESTWSKIDPTTTKIDQNVEKLIPFWLVFVLPRRPSLVFFSVWDRHIERTDRSLYNDAMYRFQNLIQNYMREGLLLFNLVSPIRKILGISSRSKRIENIKSDVVNILFNLSTPQKVIAEIDQFVKGRTIQIGVTFVLLLERLSFLLRRVETAEEIEKIVHNYEKNVQRIKRSRKRAKAKVSQSDHFKEVQPVDKPKKIDRSADKVVEFERVELQEYDGYVQISGYSQEENRNFRIYNCIEEDQLREEIWKDRKYPLRKLVSNILYNRYSSAKRLYKLKWGVDIEILDPNWLS